MPIVTMRHSASSAHAPLVHEVPERPTTTSPILARLWCDHQGGCSSGVGLAVPPQACPGRPGEAQRPLGRRQSVEEGLGATLLGEHSGGLWVP